MKEDLFRYARRGVHAVSSSAWLEMMNFPPFPFSSSSFPLWRVGVEVGSLELGGDGEEGKIPECQWGLLGWLLLGLRT